MKAKRGRRMRDLEECGSEGNEDEERSMVGEGSKGVRKHWE